MNELRLAFDGRFGRPDPTHSVTAPGRVNLIGEHVDYNGLSVFPMALDRRVTMLIRPRRDGRVRVYNLLDLYPPLDFVMSSTLERYANGEWGNYVKAAVQELTERFGGLNGFDAVMRSDIPVAAGLSSSSALVVATALALIRVNEISIDRGELMELLARAERYVGTAGGGMDQAICIGAVEGTATKIEFNPVRLFATKVPGDWRFVVANSLVRAEKSGAAREAYNRRPLECREALKMVVRRLGLTDEISSYSALMAEVPVGGILEAASEMLPAPLGKRIIHVITESVRVRQAEVAMQESATATFGRLMSASHESLRDNFSVSCIELDLLTELATASGAVGARLTGAGFGGCVIALCTSNTVDAVLGTLQNRYYATRKYACKPENVLFVARPGGGATVEEL